MEDSIRVRSKREGGKVRKRERIKIKRELMRKRERMSEKKCERERERKKPMLERKGKRIKNINLGKTSTSTAAKN